MADISLQRRINRIRKHDRVRKKVRGTSMRPRLSVYASLNHIYVQVIDDDKQCTLAATSTLEKELKDTFKENGTHCGNISAAKLVGTLIAKKAKELGISKVVFDRGGYPYHGRIKELADAAREAGLEF